MNGYERSISTELANLTFDFTQLLPNEWELLIDDDAVKKFFERIYLEKRLVLGQPLTESFKAINYFETLVSNCGFVVTVVYQSKNFSLNKVEINDIYQSLEKNMKLTEEFGAPRHTIICVAELWRETSVRREIDNPIKLSNIIVKTKRELEAQAGPLMTNLIALAQL